MTHFFEMVPFYNGRFGGANPSPIVTELPNSNSDFVDILSKHRYSDQPLSRLSERRIFLRWPIYRTKMIGGDSVTFSKRRWTVGTPQKRCDSLATLLGTFFKLRVEPNFKKMCCQRFVNDLENCLQILLSFICNRICISYHNPIPGFVPLGCVSTSDLRGALAPAQADESTRNASPSLLKGF